MSGLGPIEHVVVLMLENRSFDSMLGKLYPKSSLFDGLDGSELNRDAAGNGIRVNNRPGTDAAAMSIPDPDPGELWTDINTQLFGRADASSSTTAPTMVGFVESYLAQAAAAPGTYDPNAVMHRGSIRLRVRSFGDCRRCMLSAATRKSRLGLRPITKAAFSPLPTNGLAKAAAVSFSCSAMIRA
jgi:hypothetical protein